MFTYPGEVMTTLINIVARVQKGVASQSGFTLVEVLVATVIITTGVVGAFGVLDSANQANNVVQRHQNATEIAQREIEKLADLNYNQLALTSTPASSSDPNSPLSNVQGSQFKIDGGTSEDLAVTGGTVDPGPTTVSAGAVTAQVYRFVTWVDESNYSGCTNNCSSTHDYKRITVAVRATSSGAFKGFDRYVEVSTVRIDPFLGPQGQVSQPADPNPTQAHNNFYLYDSRSSNCTSNTYESPASDHAVHDTRDFCTATSSHYPDLMDTIAPPNPADPDTPPLYIFSTDITGAYSSGLALQRSNDCQTFADLDKFHVHSWDSDPVSNSSFQLTGKMSFDFWSAAVGGADGDGKICAWLYDRSVSGGAASDTLIANSSYDLSNWPTQPANLSFTFTHNSYTLPAGHMLHFVLTVSSQSAADLYFLYDHPNYPSFVQLRTTTPIT